MVEPRLQPKHVLLTADAVGGVWQYALELSRGLTREGIRVTLAVMGPGCGPQKIKEASRIEGLELHAADFSLEWMTDPWADLEAAGGWLLELSDKVKPDLVHLNGYVHGARPWNIPLVITGHSCVLSWWSAVKGERAPESYDRYRDAVKLGLSCADVVVAPTNAMMTELERNYSSIRTRRVIWNSRDPREFSPSKKAPFVFTCGRLWDEAKNLQLLAASAADLTWPIYVAGEQVHPDGVSVRTEGVRPLGVLSEAEVGRYMARAAVYALPARYEPFGLSILEAALSGCALVLGDIASLRELWEGAAIFVDTQDASQLTSQLNRLASDEKLREQFGSAACERAKQFNLSRQVAGYLDAYAVATLRFEETARVERTESRRCA